MGMVANISGPLLAYFDHTVEHRTPGEKIGEEIHQFFTNLFVASQVLYLFTIISVFDSRRDTDFKGKEFQIGLLKFIRLSTTLFWVFQQYCDYYDVPGDWWSYVEWYAFLNTFLCYITIATMMPFKHQMVDDKDGK